MIGCYYFWLLTDQVKALSQVIGGGGRGNVYKTPFMLFKETKSQEMDPYSIL